MADRTLERSVIVTTKTRYFEINKYLEEVPSTERTGWKVEVVGPTPENDYNLIGRSAPFWSISDAMEEVRRLLSV